VLVQGVGDVGARLAEQLAEAGARVLLSDIDTERANHLAAHVGAEVVPAETAMRTDCDIYAPCALGGTLSAETIPHLRCRIVAGCANNQLAETEDAAGLAQAGILYAPDYVINAGGVIHAWGVESLGWDHDTVETRLAGVGTTLTDIYEYAEAEGITTEAAAEKLARSRLAQS
jgi:glutamate dehydrogenase/leucine dehydrogenase